MSIAVTARFRLPAFVLVAMAWHAAPATAGTLYKCVAANGVIAYTNHEGGAGTCSVLSRYADAPPAKSVGAPPPRPATAAPARPTPNDGAAVAAAPAPAATASARHGWVYEENAKEKADFSGVAAGAASSATVLAQSIGVAAATAAKDGGKAVASTAPAPPRVLRGAVYRVTRNGGITEYTNVKPSAGAFAVLFTYIATCVACDVHSKIDFARTALNLDAYRDEIAAAAADFGVDGSLLRAVIHAESAFNPMAVSSKGAQGLMQLMPATAGDLGVTDAFDVVQNIRGGARYLAQLLKDFNGDAQLATAAYNAGEASVQKYRGVPPYDETQVYVQRVATLRDRYQKAL